MIGKVIKGKSFKGCVSYVMGKNDAKLLDSEGVLKTDTESIIDSFYLQSLMNPNLTKSVGHIPLSYSKEDKEKLTDKMMIRLAKEYMQLMKIENTQYIIVRHNDTGHPHCHIVFNRVNNEGKTISDKNDYRRNEKATKALKEKYGLTFGQGKDHTNTQKLKEPDKTKYEIYQAIKSHLSTAKHWKQFQAQLHQQNITIQFKYKGQIEDIQGISFKKGDYTFKGSQIDRNFSYSKLNRQIENNNTINPNIEQTALSSTTNQYTQQNTQSSSNQSTSIIGSVIDGLETGTSIQHNTNNYEEESLAKRLKYEHDKRMCKNKRKKGRRL